MTVQNSYAPTSYAGDGITTAFTIPWSYQVDTDIVAQVTVVATGVVTTLVLGTDYNVTPNTSTETLKNGTLNLLGGALALGSDLTISRAPALDQVSTWTENFANPAKLSENGLDKLTLIVQGLSYAISQINTGGPTVATTTANYVMQAVGITQSIAVTTTMGLRVGNSIQISNVSMTMIGQVTAIASLTSLTVKTLAITSGAAGNIMPAGSPIQLGYVPGQSTLVTQDNLTSTTASFLAFNGDADAAAGASPVGLYISSIEGNLVNISGYVGAIDPVTTLLAASTQSYPRALYFPGSLSNPTYTGSTAGVGSVLFQDTSTTFKAALLTAANITTGSLTPALLFATNSPADTQLPSYDAASGHFKWVNPGGGGGLPGGGTAGAFLRGDVTWSSFLNLSVGTGALLFGNSEATNSLAGFLSVANINDPGVNNTTVIGAAKKGASTWSFSGAGNLQSLQFWNTILVARIDANACVYNAIDASNVEVAQFGGPSVPGGGWTSNIVRAHAFRSGAGYWKFMYTIPSTTGAITLDLKNGAHQRQASVTGNITYTLTDTTSAPTASGWQFSDEMLLEINAPGANTITWPGNITWANGASAPTLSASGVNLIKLVRRQGLTQWLGYQLNNAGSGGTYTDAQARTAVLQSTYFLASSSISWTISGGTSVTPSIAALGVTNSMLAGGISASKLSGFPSNAALYLDGSGSWSTPSGSSFSTAVAHSWTGIQAFNVEQIFTAQTVGTGSGAWGSSGSVSTVYLNGNTQAPSSLPGDTVADAASFYIELTDNYNTPVGHGGIYGFVLEKTNTSSGSAGAARLGMRTTVSPASNTFAINFTEIHEIARMAGATGDGVWLNAWGPDSNFSATPDATGIIHAFSSGFIRIGEVNYGNAWADFGRIEDRASATRLVCGIEYIPDWLAGSTGDTNPTKYPASWALSVVASGLAPNNSFATHWTGIYFDIDSIKGGTGTYGTGGYGIHLRGSSLTVGTGKQQFACYTAVRVKEGWDIGIDLSQATITAESTSGHSNQAAIMLAQGQAICFKAPTGANTGVFMQYNGTNLRVTKDGGNTWTNLV